MQEYVKCDNCVKRAIIFLKSKETIRCFKCNYENYKPGIEIKLCDIYCGRISYNWACYDHKFTRVHNFIEIKAIYSKEDECKVCEQPYFPKATFVGTVNVDQLCNHCDEIKKYDFTLNKDIICSNCPTVLFKKNYVISLCQECYCNSNDINDVNSGIWKIEEYTSSETNDILANCELKKPLLCSECFVMKQKK